MHCERYSTLDLYCDRTQRWPQVFAREVYTRFCWATSWENLFSNHGTKLGFVCLSNLGRRKNVECFDPLRDFVFGDFLREQKFSQFL